MLRNCQGGVPPMSQQFPNIDIDNSRLTILTITHISNNKKVNKNKFNEIWTKLRKSGIRYCYNNTPTLSLVPRGTSWRHHPYDRFISNSTHFRFYRQLINTVSIIIYICTHINRFIYL